MTLETLPQKMLKKKGGHVYANHEVTAIHPENKTVTVKDLTNNSEEEVQYDGLILSSGVTLKFYLCQVMISRISI